MTAIPQPSPPGPKGRLLLGGGVLVAGQLSPVFIPFVASSGWSIGLKAALSGLLLLGIPELTLLVAIAIVGKAGFTYLKRGWFALLKRAAPIDHVSRMRYRIGLVLFGAPLLMGWATPYVRGLIPKYGDYDIALAIAGDGLLVLGLFLLGGDFWDKLRALFIHGATVRLPSAQAVDGAEMK